MSRIRQICAGPERARLKEASLPHILLVVDQLPKALGGGERIVLRMAEMLPSYGYRASILTFAADAGSPALLDPPCPIYLLPLERTYDLNAFLGALSLRRFLADQRVAIVHTCFESSDLWAGAVTKLFSRAKLVWNRRDMGILRDRKHVIAYRRLARLPDAVFTVAETVRRYSIEVDRLPPERVITIHNGLDLSDWPDVTGGGQGEELTFASLGNIRQVKGHDVLLKAFRLVHLQYPAAKLLVGGAVLETDFKRDLDCYVDEHGLGANVSFVGSIGDQQSFLERASFFVMPSRSEGFSNAIVEAMAAALPVVATKVGGNGEAVVDGETGLLVASEDVEAMAAAMLKLLQDPTRARVMGKEGRRRVLECFTIEAMMTRITSTFSRLLQGPPLT